MKKEYTSILLFCLIVITGGALRLSNLEYRPMHNDEAVNSMKFGTLLETGNFSYDKMEYHGPILYFLTLAPAWLTNTRTYSDLHEYQLRLIPVLAGIGLLFLLLMMKKTIGWKLILSVTLIGAISPAMVFYSRYYIHEMLLLFFTYGFLLSVFALFKYRHYGWLILAGAFLGLMHTTKETFILAVAAMVLAILLDQVLWKKGPVSYGQALRSMKWHHYLVFISMAGIISVVFFSSIFKNPQGIIDSVTTYEGYFSKAGKSEIHRHPWHYYLSILAWNEGPSYLVWSELSILLLAFAGIIQVFQKKEVKEKDQFFRLIALFSIVLLVVYSAIPYKTPWNMLSFFFGLIMMAGYGIIKLTQGCKKNWLRVVIWILAAGAALHLVSQVVLTNYRYPAHPSNPYVYGHTAMDINHMIHRIREAASFHPESKDLYIQVICSEHDYWPLPWYLRDFKNVGWWDRVDTESPLAPLIISSPDLEDQLIIKMYTMPAPGEKYLYIPLFDVGTQIRPGVTINGYIRQDYWGF